MKLIPIRRVIAAPSVLVFLDHSLWSTHTACGTLTQLVEHSHSCITSAHEPHEKLLYFCNFYSLETLFFLAILKQRKIEENEHCS